MSREFAELALVLWSGPASLERRVEGVLCRDWRGVRTPNFGLRGPLLDEGERTGVKVPNFGLKGP